MGKHKVTKKRSTLIFDIVIIGILISTIAIFLLFFIDSAFNLGEYYVSRLALGDYSLPFKFFLTVMGIVVLTSLPALFDMVHEQVKDSTAGHNLFTVGAVIGVLGVVFIFPIVIFDMYDQSEYNLFGWQITAAELHAIFAMKFFSFMLLFVYLILLSQFFASMAKYKKMLHVHKAGYAVIVFVTLLFLLIDVVELNPMVMFGTGSVILLIYLFYALWQANATNNLKLNDISIQSRLLVIIVIIDFVLILYGDRGDLFAIFRGEWSSINPDPFSSFETVLVTNILFLLGYVYLDARFKIGKILKK